MIRPIIMTMKHELVSVMVRVPREVVLGARRRLLEMEADGHKESLQSVLFHPVVEALMAIAGSGDSSITQGLDTGDSTEPPAPSVDAPRTEVRPARKQTRGMCAKA